MEANRKAPAGIDGDKGMAGNGAGAPSDGEALAALGPASVDDGAAAAGLHANEKAVGTGAADFGCLVSAFHGDFLTCPETHKEVFRETRDYRKHSARRQSGAVFRARSTRAKAVWIRL
jgi:hypothetical protein